MGQETRSFEVKGPGSVDDKAFCAKVARAVMAMGNLRDGGLVVLGIDQTEMPRMLPGLSPEQFAGWSDSDRVASAIARYSDPPVTFTVAPLRLSSGASVVALEVVEFDTTPHLCARDYPGEVVRGAAYVRARGKPQSVSVPSVSEMRELLDLAIAKGVREFVRRAGLARAIPSTGSDRGDERTLFSAEAEAAWSPAAALAPVLVRAAHFDVAVRPSPYDVNRVAPVDLQEFMSNHTVRFRGWPVPFVDTREAVARHGSWIGQDEVATVVPHAEAWRLCTSGQFLQRRVLTTDLRDPAELKADAPGATGAVALWDVLLYAVEVAELAARVATTLDCARVMIELGLRNIAGRQLVSGTWERELFGPYVIQASDIAASVDVRSAELIFDPPGAGVALTQQLIGQFGAKLPDALLRDWQAEVLRRDR